MKYEAIIIAREGCHAVVLERGLSRGEIYSLNYLTVRLDETDDSGPGDQVGAYNVPRVFPGTPRGLCDAASEMMALERNLRKKSS